MIKSTKWLTFIVVATFVSQAAQAGVRFFARNNTPNYISLRFSGDNTWYLMSPNSEASSFFNNGLSTLNEIEWVVPEKGHEYWKAAKYQVKNAGIQEGGKDHLVILPDGVWTWEGNRKSAASKTYLE